KQIIINALNSNNYFLIQGPPGTGKTSFILRYLTQILFNNTNENVLLVAYTNRAVEEICSNLIKIKNVLPDFDFIRIGSPENSQYTEHLLSNIGIDEFEKRIYNCRIFVTTILTAHSQQELFFIKDIDTIIVDEAAQILESNIIGLLSKCKRFIMIGDEKQLPPISIQQEKYLKVNDKMLVDIGLNNLKCSLFERLLKICKTKNYPAFALLDKQYRMSNEIMSLANSLFYDNKLVLGDECLEKEDNKVMEYSYSEFFSAFPFNKSDCFFINTPAEKHSKINSTEVNIIVKLITKIKEKIAINNKTIGIISPWRMQCNDIRNKLNEDDKNKITIDTVERFQGSERDIIILSLATNSSYLLNILSNKALIDDLVVDRKLNVAITRAKKKLIILGNYEILSQDDIYKKLIDKVNKVV
ncbi:MAG: DEAD/DEAH box helicase family protein, partial [Bacteroidetes bacterium]|nr:DEAD/DEAH box helicase family protein [Bacteroidota bacterium]